MKYLINIFQRNCSVPHSYAQKSIPIGCADRIFAFYSKFSYGQRSKCADLLNTYFPAYINLETALRICGPAMIAMMIFAVSPGRYGITPMPRAATKLIPSCPASHAVPKI